MLRRSDHLVSLHAAAPNAAVALCAAMPLVDAGAGAPEWVHLLPAGTITTGDGRGPYQVANVATLMAASLPAGEKLVLDENHATDLAAPRGEAAPARGWIVELQARDDGVWGKVDWTEDGRRLIEGKAYRGVSPVIQHQPNGTVTALLRASLVNRPNLRGLTALHSANQTLETSMNPLLEKLLKALGLPAATTEAAAIAAVTTMHASQAQSSTALQAALDPIAKAIGLQAGADATAVLAGVQTAATGKGGNDQVVTALQAELTELATKFNALAEGTRKKDAEAYVDDAIKAGRVGVKPMRDRYVTMHMADAAGTEALIGAMPIVGGSGRIVLAAPPTAGKDGEIALNAEQLHTCKVLGLDPKEYAETLKAEREEAL